MGRSLRLVRLIVVGGDLIARLLYDAEEKLTCQERQCG